MKQLVEFPLEDGTTLLVEINEAEDGGLVKASRAGDAIEKAQQTLEKSLEKVQPAAQFIIQQLRKLHDAPNEIQVVFGLKLNAEAGVVLASGSIEANYTVTLKWVKEDPKDSKAKTKG
jgi:hypothetical protein